MNRLERITGFLAASGCAAAIVVDVLTGVANFSTFERILFSCVAILCYAAVLPSWRRRRPRRGPQPCGCWVNPQSYVVFVEADLLYRCILCDMRWTRSAWKHVELKHVIPNLMDCQP